jgi:hypothetical protein
MIDSSSVQPQYVTNNNGRPAYQFLVECLLSSIGTLKIFFNSIQISNPIKQIATNGLWDFRRRQMTRPTRKIETPHGGWVQETNRRNEVGSLICDMRRYMPPNAVTDKMHFAWTDTIYRRVLWDDHLLDETGYLIDPAERTTISFDKIIK